MSNDIEDNETHMLDSLMIKNFRMLRDFELAKLGQVNLIVGKNNSGKSSVLEALQIFAKNADQSALEKIASGRGEKYRINTDEHYHSTSLIPFQDLFTDRIFPVDDNTEIQIGSLNKPEEILRIRHVFQIKEEETVTHETGERDTRIRRRIIPKSEIHHSSGDIEQALLISKGDTSHSPINLSRKQFRVSLLSLLDAIPCNVIPTQFVSEDELADAWDNIVLYEAEESVKSALRIIEPDFEDLTFVRADTQGNKLQRTAKVKLKNLSMPVSLYSLGDGMVRVLQLAIKLTSSQGGFLLIDEFENGLHYSVQEKIWDFLFNIAKQLDIQIFATTHSWDCIESFSKVALKHPDSEGILFRMGKSAKTSDRGRVIATIYDATELETITQADMEVR